MVQLDPSEISFPDPAKYNPPSGLIAVGGDLSVPRILFAYQLGIFPWYNPGEEILWWSPDPRFVLFPKDVYISKSMKKILKKNEFKITYNQNFREVMQACQKTARNHQDGTWINDELIETFVRLHEMGIATSVEVWKDGKLAGGLYGLQLGRVFCGESMFSAESNASKAGFIQFVKDHEDNFDLIDCQIHSDHLESLGAQYMSKQNFLTYLSK